jgi:hypothetical protein
MKLYEKFDKLSDAFWIVAIIIFFARIISSVYCMITGMQFINMQTSFWLIIITAGFAIVTWGISELIKNCESTVS